MFTPRMHSVEKTLAAGILALAVLPSTSFSEDFSLRVADGDRALFQDFLPPAADAEALAGMKGGFHFGLDVTTTYDSNFFILQDYPESELITDITPHMMYRSDPEGNALWSVEAEYAPVLHTYWNNSHLNGVDHSGAFTLKYSGARTKMDAFISYDEVSSADRLAGGFIEGSILNYGIKGSYEVGPRTTLLGALTASQSDYDSGARSGSDIYTAQLSGLWDATERIRLGPVLRYTYTEADQTGERKAIAALMNMRYKWHERIFFDAMFGLEWAENSRQNGGYDVGPAGGLEAMYVINDRWTWKGGIHYSVVPSPVNLNYMAEDLSFDTSLIRHFQQGSLEMGLGISFTNYDPVGLIVSNREDDDFFHAFITYRRKIFMDRVMWTSSLRAATNEGQKDWSQWQLSTGLSMEF